MTDHDLPPEWISDLDLLRLIERVTRQPATLADAKAWRQSFERERARRALRRVGRRSVPRSADIESAHAVIVHMLLSPECQIIIAVLVAGRSLAEDRLDVASRRVYDRLHAERSLSPDMRADVNGLLVYATEKMAFGGRPAMRGCDPAHALPGLALAALNGATLPALADWCSRLVSVRRSPATRPHLIARLCSVGAEVCAACPDLDIDRPLSGPPLGVWPPASPNTEPSADSPPISSVVALRR